MKRYKSKLTETASHNPTKSVHNSAKSVPNDDLSRKTSGKNPADSPKLSTLFKEFFTIATFTLGGGAVMLPLMQQTFVKKHPYLSTEEMIDIYTMINSMPGVIAVNAASLIGYKVKGVRGAAVSLLGVTLVPVLVIMLLAVAIAQIRDIPWVQAGFRGIRAAVTGLMFTILLRMGSKVIFCWIDLLIAVAAFVLIAFFQVHGLLIIAGAAIAGWALHTLREARMYPGFRDEDFFSDDDETDDYGDAETYGDATAPQGNPQTSPPTETQKERDA